MKGKQKNKRKRKKEQGKKNKIFSNSEFEINSTKARIVLAQD